MTQRRIVRAIKRREHCHQMPRSSLRSHAVLAG
jgi:hypothetical protein